MNRIARVSRVFHILFMVVLIFLPLFVIISWILAPDFIALGGGANGISYNPIPSHLHIESVLTPAVKLLAFLVNMLTVAPSMLLLIFLIKLFKNYEHEKIFSLENVNLIRNVGYTLIVWQLLVPIQQGLLSLVLTWHNAPGQHVLEMSFNSTNISVIVIAFIVILISWVMAEAHKLQQESEYTV